MWTWKKLFFILFSFFMMSLCCAFALTFFRNCNKWQCFSCQKNVKANHNTHHVQFNLILYCNITDSRRRQSLNYIKLTKKINFHKCTFFLNESKNKYITLHICVPLSWQHVFYGCMYVVFFCVHFLFTAWSSTFFSTKKLAQCS